LVKTKKKILSITVTLVKTKKKILSIIVTLVKTNNTRREHWFATLTEAALDKTLGKLKSIGRMTTWWDLPLETNSMG